MKKRAKIFLIIGMCLTFYFIFPVVLGILAIKKIDNAKTSDELTTWGIVCIFFVSILGGIFILLIKENEFDNLEKNTNNNGYDDVINPAIKIMELKQLKDDGIIDETTYQEKRSKYVEEL